MQSKTENLPNVAKTTGLEININKNKSLCINATQTEVITIDDNALMISNNLPTLAVLSAKLERQMRISRQGSVKQEVHLQTLRQYERINNLSTHTKLRLFNTTVKSVLLYGSETCNL